MTDATQGQPGSGALPDVDSLFPAKTPDVDELFPAEVEQKREQTKYRREQGHSALEDALFSNEGMIGRGVHAAGRVLDAMGQGFKDHWGAGTELSEESEKWLTEHGAINDYRKGQFNLALAANRALLRVPAAAMAAQSATFGAVQAGAAQIGVETGHEQLGREVAALPEAFPTFGHELGVAKPPVADIAKARELGVVGEGEAGWKGTAAPASAPKLPILLNTKGHREFTLTPEGEPVVTPSGADETAAAVKPAAPAEPAPAAEAPPPDIHAAARQIDPDTFREYDDLTARRDTFRRWIDELRDTRDREAETAAPHGEEIADLTRRIEDPDTTPRLRKKYQARLAPLIDERDAHLEDAQTGDTADMAKVRQKLQEADYRMRDLAPNVTAAYRKAREGMPEEAGAPAEAAPPDQTAAPVTPDRAGVQALLDRKASPEEIARHPVVVKAAADNDGRPQTKDLPGYGTPEFEAKREFDFDGEKVVGYPAAIDRLTDKARSYSTNGPVKRESVATIVLGPPASGKSRLSEKLAAQRHAAIVDPDDAKLALPEYDGGVGTSATHEESAHISAQVLKELLSNGENVVIPRVGGNLDSVRGYVEGLSDAGYKVNLVNLTVDPAAAYRRMIRRFLKTGRIIGSDYFSGVGTKPRENYYVIKGEGNVHEAIDIDGNGPPGTHPVLDGAGTDLAAALGEPGGGHRPALAGGDTGGRQGSQKEEVTPVDIAADVARRLIAAGRPPEEAHTHAAWTQAYWETRAARFKGAKGTAAEMYSREAADIRGKGVAPARPSEPPAARPEIVARAEQVLRRSVSESVSTFTTAKGSTYQVHEDGTTTRNKAARSDVGHEGDSGPKPRTERTVYVDDARLASALSAAGLQNLGSKGARLVIKDGKASLLTWNEKAGQWGRSQLSSDIPVSKTPAVGKAPLELWGKADDVPAGYEAYRNQHAGNKITQVGESSAPERVTAAAVRTKDGRVFTGIHHGDALEKATAAGVDIKALTEGDGFTTSTGRYVDRKEARAIADKAEQVEADETGRTGGKYLMAHQVFDATGKPYRNPDLPAAAQPAPLPSDLPNGVAMFSPADLKVDAKRFQFKDGGDEAGVTDRLKGVTKWDPIKAGTILVWQDKAGQHYVVDGHQRHALATRIAADPNQKPQLLARVLREADGVSDSDARISAASKNIAEGTGTAVDAAKVLRDRPDLISDLPQRSELVRTARGLVNLSDEAFRLVINDVVPPNYAAIVGRLVPADPEMQGALLGLLAKTEPANAIQAEAIVRQGIEAGAAKKEKGAQASLFGDDDIAESLYLDRAKVLDRALREIKQDKKIFSVLTKDQTAIEAAGNKLATDINEKRNAADAQALQILQTLAGRKGPISDALGSAAERARSDGKYPGAVREFIGKVRRLVESGDLARLADGIERRETHVGDENTAGAIERAPESVKPKAEAVASEQTLELLQQDRTFYQRQRRGLAGQMDIFGGEAASDADLAQRRANAPLKPSVAQKPADQGLFGDAARQTDLVDMARARAAVKAPAFTTPTNELERRIKDASDRLEKDPKDQKAASELGQLLQENDDRAGPTLFQDAGTVRRGRIRVRDDGRNTITMLRDANASTFPHEFAHDALERMMRDAEDGEAPPEMKADARTVLKWLGVDKASEIKTRHHERFARGWETYLMEGRAPTRALANVFAKMRQWFLDIYKKAENLGAPINDEMRGVFDRMLAMKPEDVTIAPEPKGKGDFAERHEATAESTAPENARETAGTTQAERDNVFNRHGTEKHEPRLADVASGTERRAEGGRELDRDGNEPGPSAGEGGSEAQGPALGASRGEAAGGGAKARGKPSGPSVKTEPPAAPNATFKPTPSGLLDKAGNIRLDNLGQPEDVNRVIRAAADAIGARRGVISDAQVLDLADALGMDAADLSVRKLGQAFNAEQIMAARKLLIQSATAVRDAMAKAAEGNEADVLAYAQAKTRHQMIQEQVAGITAEADRALRAFREIAGLKEAQAIGDFLKDATGRTLFQLQREAQLGLALDTPQKVSKFVNDSKKPGFGDMVLEYWINGLISGPATHTTYAAGNEILALNKAGPETAVAAGIGALRRLAGDDGPRVYFGEVPRRLFALISGIPKGLVAAYEAAKTGKTAMLPGEVENMTARQLAMSPLVNPRAAIPNFTIAGVPVPVGTLARLPSRAIAMIHSFFRAVNYESEMAGLAYRTASEEGLSGDAFAARIGEVRTNPDEGLMNQARASATDLTLMGKGGELTQALSRLTNARFLGFQWLKFIDPFVHISSNVIEQAVLQRTPVGILDPEIRANLAGANGPVARDMAIARMAVGSAIGLGVGSLAAQGLINGSGPSDPKEQAISTMVNGPPHSVRVGNMWYDVHRLGPLGMLLSITADLYEVAHVIETQDAAHVVHTVSHAFTQNILDESFMRGPSDLIKALSDPDRYGAGWVRNFISSFTPYSVGQAQIARAVDPYSRSARTTLDAVKAKIPWLSETLLPRRDIFGEPVPNRDALGVAGLSAIYEAKVNNDPVPKAMLAAGYFPAMPERKIRGVQLTDEQYDDYARIAGRTAKMRLDNIVRMPGFATLPDGVRHDMMQKAVTSAHEMAASMILMQNQDIIRQAVDAKTAKLKTPEPVH